MVQQMAEEPGTVTAVASTVNTVLVHVGNDTW